MVLERAFVEVTSEHILAKATKKNLLQILVRLQGKEKQEVSSWAGLHISVRNKVQVSQDVIGYLPTFDAPATDMAAVHVKSLKIKIPLKLKSIVLVFDQALYAKAMEIQWKQSDVLRMGVFHTACTMLSVLGKCFQDAGLRDLCVESGVLADSSVAGVIEGRRYNRGVRLHKLVYEALMRLVVQGFRPWIEENHAESKTVANNFLSETAQLYMMFVKGSSRAYEQRS